MDSKRNRTTVILVTIVLVAVAAGAVYLLLGQDGPIEVSSPWPRAVSERSIPKPAEPLVWPLTGLPVQEGVTPQSMRILSVKIENSAAARPQAGLQAADVVYESITEGGITRFNCMFHSNNPDDLVGPVRSARLSDISIVPQYGALFAFSGANGVVNAAVRSAGIEDLSQDAGVSYGYKRVSNRAAPHNLYIDLAKMREEAGRRGYSANQQIKPLAFERSSAEGTVTVRKVAIPFSPANTSRWEYDAPRAVYLRVNNGKTHTDALTGEQISAVNVIVLWAKMTATSKRDVTGSTTYDIELVGTGRGALFRGGQQLDLTWEATAQSPPSFKAADGSPVRLAPGNTWFQVVPTGVNISME